MEPVRGVLDMVPPSETRRCGHRFSWCSPPVVSYRGGAIGRAPRLWRRKNRAGGDAKPGMSSPRDRTAFVLSGGASLGAVQVGMLQALYERDIAPELIVGTSAGAVNGAFIASRPQSVETATELAEIWRKVRRGQIFPLNPLSGLLGFFGSRDHLVPASGLRKRVAEHSQHQSLEQMPIEFHVVAVDVVTGEELLLSRGPTVDAVLASAAIPAVLPPVAWGKRLL